MGYECDNLIIGAADNPPFSIRQFVLAARRKDIFCCWPFPQKYLEICLKYGISNVLPPFETYKATIETTDEIGHLACSQQDKELELLPIENEKMDIVAQEKLIKDDYTSYLDEVLLQAPCHDSFKTHGDESNLTSDYTSNAIVPVYDPESISIQGSDFNLCQRINSLSPKRLRYKRRKRRGREKLKKRSMVDILARAKLCTLEDFYSTRCNSICIANDVDESSRLIAHVEDINDEDEASNDNLSSSMSRVVRIKLGGCTSKSWHIN